MYPCDKTLISVGIRSPLDITVVGRYSHDMQGRRRLDATERADTTPLEETWPA